MPAKNAVKQYLENGYYHIYNRGVEKRIIFQDTQDYSVFLSYLKEYLLPKDEKALRDKLSSPDVSLKEKDKILRLLRLNNFNKEIYLLAYCLMPNHFHFFIKQKSGNSIDKFMNSLCTRYSMYFNKKYKRVGSLYQGVYKAVLIKRNDQFIYLSKYIHVQAIQSRTPSSYMDYLNLRKTAWLAPDEVLSFFTEKFSNLSYQSFLRENDAHEVELKEIIFEKC